ncbi:MAG: ankyrin repeat domain-containing protein [Methanomassiliicoccaceae archaeon]|nr:ankyrin repeat domain-containing protein [Methanomassiliicoccaceae archaeon]
MIKLKDIGNFEAVPQVAMDILNGDISALDRHLEQGWDIGEKIKLGRHISLSALDCALIGECFDSVKWLVSHGADMNAKDGPCFLTAVRYCGEDIIRYVVSNGAKVDGVNSVGSDAFSEALFGRRYENLPLIQGLGHPVKKYGGDSFRRAVFGKNYEALDFFISQGVDIDYRKPDTVYPYGPTPLCVAARHADMQMCRYLVGHGADVTIAEKGGMRPYSIAVERGDMEMAEYFRSLEPAEFHSLQNKLDELGPFKLPKPLLDFLMGDRLHIDLPECDFGFIDFFPLADTVPMKVGRQRLLRISRTTGDYDHIVIVWNPKTKKMAYYDEEHTELGDVCGFEEFIEDPAACMSRIFD